MKIIDIAKEIIEIQSYPEYTKDEINPKSGEEKLAKYIEEFMRKYCPYLSVEKQSVYSGRYNLIFSDNNPTKLIFCCHMDTVPPKQSQLINGKLTSKIIGDKLFGLGSVDMKGGIASLLSTLSSIKKSTKGLVIIFYCDEEYNFFGMKKIITEKKFNAKLSIFCEPTNLKIANGCRGLIEFFGYVKGKTAHASRPEEGLNAILLATNAFSLFQKKINNYFHSKLGVSTCNFSGIEGGLLQKSKNNDYDITWSGNNVPNIAKIQIEVRAATENLNAQKVIQIYNNAIKKLNGNFELKKIVHDYGSFFVDQNKLLLVEQAITDSNYPVNYLDISKVGYYDAEMFARTNNIPSISLGPGPNNMSHKNNEYVSINSMNKVAKIYKLIINKFLA